jgi:plastocyanin domain-containing protein
MRALILVVGTLALVGCKKEEAARPPEPVKAVEAPKPVEPPKEAEVAKAAAPTAGRRIDMEVTNDGFQPGNVTLKANEPVTFVVTRKTDSTCATDLLIDGTDIKKALPLNQPVEIAWTPTKAGKVKFGCAMDMMIGGVLLVE